VVKATCPVRGALGGNPLSRGSTDAVLRLHLTEKLLGEQRRNLQELPTWIGGEVTNALVGAADP
jgi:hypothetical protein